MFYYARDSSQIQNIQINKVIGENKKMCFFNLMEKTEHTFWPTQYLPLG